MLGWHEKGPGFDSQYCINNRKGGLSNNLPYRRIRQPMCLWKYDRPRNINTSDLTHSHAGKVPRIVTSVEKGAQNVMTTAYMMCR